MFCRGIRGAITVEQDQAAAILAATQTLLQRIVVANQLAVDDIASVTFTATSDLTATSPARAAREMGWVRVPMLCMPEMDVAGGLSRCIRVLILWHTNRSQEEIRHVYLGEALALRPDLVEE